MNGKLAKETSGMVEQFTAGRGEESEGSGVMNPGKGDMADKPGYELVYGESDELDLGSCFVLVAQKEIIGAFSGETAVGDRAAADVAAEILNDTAAMLVWWHDPDMPFCFAKQVEEVDALLTGKTIRKEELAGIEGFAEEGKELAAEFGPEDAGREKETLLCAEPAPVWGKAASGEEEMNVGMNPEGLSPTVE